MRVLRVILGLIILAWAAMSAFSMGGMALYKLDPDPNVPEYAQRLIPLFEAVPWWMFGLWLVVWLRMLTAAWRLFKGGPALGPFVTAFAAHIALWWFMSRLPAYQQGFTPGELAADYFIIAGMAAVAFLIWLTDRPGRLRNFANFSGAGAYAMGDSGSYHRKDSDGGDSGGSDGGGGD